MAFLGVEYTIRAAGFAWLASCKAGLSSVKVSERETGRDVGKFDSAMTERVATVQEAGGRELREAARS